MKGLSEGAMYREVAGVKDLQRGIEAQEPAAVGGGRAGEGTALLELSKSQAAGRGEQGGEQGKLGSECPCLPCLQALPASDLC